MYKDNSREERYIYIRTFGCQMNVHDSEQMAELLRNRGYRRTDDVSMADLIIVNTCSIREKAEQKAFSQIGRFRNLKKRKPGLMIGVCGCLAQQWGAELLERVPFVDMVFGTYHIHHLPQLIDRVKDSGKPAVETSLLKETESLGILAVPRTGAVTSYVTIMQGCDNYCAYCVVPYLRGREMSREEGDILREVEALSGYGVKEVTLLGQNVNSYGKTLANGASFSRLLRKIGKIRGIDRIRFTTSHPRDLSDDVVRCFGEVEALCEHIHLPVQSGSDQVLKRMNRKYTSGDYLDCVAKLRKVSRGISITTDIIVGFPGETESDFYDTLNLMDAVRFDGLFSFKYSDRPGTAAAAFSDKVAEEVKSDRLIRIQAIQDTYAFEKNKSLEGSIEDVLVEGTSKNYERDVSGRTRSNRIVNFHADRALIGNIVSVRIKRAYLHSLRGEMLGG